MILHRAGAAQFLKFNDILGLLIACLCHDIGHPGTNNAFQVNAKTKFAITYNDKAVLESFHASRTFEIILSGDKDLNIMQTLTVCL